MHDSHTTIDIQERCEEMFQLFFEKGIVGMTLYSPAKGWLQINDIFCGMLGYTREELARLSFTELTHPDDLEADRSQYQRVIDGEIDGYSLEKRYLRKDGATVYAILSLQCIRSPDGQVEYIIAIIQDISTQKRAEENLTRYKHII